MSKRVFGLSLRGLNSPRNTQSRRQFDPFRLFGGSSSYDHGRFVYVKHIGNLHFIDDSSQKGRYRKISLRLIDMILTLFILQWTGFFKFSEFRECFQGHCHCSACRLRNYPVKKRHCFLRGFLRFVDKRDDTEIPFPVFVKLMWDRVLVELLLIRSEKELALYKPEWCGKPLDLSIYREDTPLIVY